MSYSFKNRRFQKKARKQTFLYLFLTLVVIGIFAVLGVKVLVNIINVISDVKKSDSPLVSDDNIPPMVPYLNILSEYTNTSELEIKGNSEPSSLVILHLNGKDTDTVAGNTGSFLFKVALKEGGNDFYLYSKDASGNISQNTKTYTVNFDKTPPVLDISSPQNNSNITGSKNKVVEIKGVSEKDATVTINDRFVYTSDEGTFIYKYDLSNGENKFTIRSKDSAGNETSKEFILFYQE